MWTVILPLLGYTILLMILIWFLITLVYTPLWAAYICFKGSKSFFFASIFYPLKIRNRIFIFYSFARLGDDLIDDYKGKQQEINLKFLNKILDFCYAEDENTKTIYYKELESLLLLIPILPNTFNTKNIKKVIINLDSISRECNIPRWLFELLLYGFKMDTNKTEINDEEDLLIYCICVASSIGLICTCLYQDGTIKINDKLLSNAAALGIGFQLTNISRDIVSDLKELKKIYIPKTWMNQKEKKIFEEMKENNELIEEYRNTLIRDYAVKLIKMAEIYYIDSWNGINDLPNGVQLAIHSALLIYREIGINILSKNIYPNRSFIPIKQKIYLLLKSSQKPNFYLSQSFKNRAFEMLQITKDKIKN